MPLTILWSCLRNHDNAYRKAAGYVAFDYFVMANNVR
jgi:hypothetical protein